MRLSHLVTRPRGEAGVTLVELGVALSITALLSTLMVTWFAAGVGSENSHSSYDAALNDLRTVSDRMSREVRAAGTLSAIAADSLTFWLDLDRDGTEDEGETITWTISGRAMLRGTDALEEPAVIATNLAETSAFLYDAEDPALVTRVTLDLVAAAQTRAGRDLVEYSIDIYLRNA